MTTCDCTTVRAPISTSAPIQREGANFHILGETGVGIDQGGRMNLHKHARFLEAEIGESAFRRRTDDDMIEQFDLEQFGRLAQASR